MINKIIRIISMNTSFSFSAIKEIYNLTGSLDRTLQTVWLSYKLNLSLKDSDILIRNMMQLIDDPNLFVFPHKKEADEFYNKEIKPE